MAKHEKVIELQRSGETRWKSQAMAASALLKTKCAMEKAVVDASFKKHCLLEGRAESRQAAAAVVEAVKRDKNWEELRMVQQLLKPLSDALHGGQSDRGGMGSVRSAFFRLDHHFKTFDYPPTAERYPLRQHVTRSVVERKEYTLRPVHTLAYVLDPRYIDRPDQPDTGELAQALRLLKELATAHDIKIALKHHRCSEESALPNNYVRETAENIMAQYTSFRSKSFGHLVMPEVWENDTVLDPLSWWLSWGGALPHVQAVAVKVMKLPVGFAAGERSFSNAVNIQSKLRTKLSYTTLHKLLYIYFNSRVLPGHVDMPACSSSQLALHTVELEEVADEPEDEGDDEGERSGGEGSGEGYLWNDVSGGEDCEEDLLERATRNSTQQSNK